MEEVPSSGTTEHYDSVGNTSDYSTETNVLFVNASITATEKLNFYLEGVYTNAKGSFDPFDLPTPEIDEPDANIYPDDTSTADYDFSGINEYSDLDYTTLEFTIGTNYRIDDKTSVYGAVNLMDMTDDQPYVYGDLTGALVTYSAGMTMKF